MSFANLVTIMAVCLLRYVWQEAVRRMPSAAIRLVMGKVNASHAILHKIYSASKQPRSVKIASALNKSIPSVTKTQRHVTNVLLGTRTAMRRIIALSIVIPILSVTLKWENALDVPQFMTLVVLQRQVSVVMSYVNQTLVQSATTSLEYVNNAKEVNLDANLYLSAKHLVNPFWDPSVIMISKPANHAILLMILNANLIVKMITANFQNAIKKRVSASIAQLVQIAYYLLHNAKQNANHHLFQKEISNAII